jgi:hypothetical protein
MSTRFQEIVTSALSANYVGSDWFDEFPNLRFATEVVNRNVALANILEKYGHSYIFDIAQSGGWAEEIEQKIGVRFEEDPIGLEEFPPGEDTILNQTTGDIFVWLTKVYETSRDFELGTFDGSLLAMTMKTQSSKWEPIAIGYIKDVICMAHKFIQDLLRLVCLDRRVQEALMSVLMDELWVKYEGALDHVRFLLRVERTGTPASLNNHFTDNLEER